MYMENLNMWYFVLNILDKFEKVFSKLFMDVHFQTIGFIHRLLRSEGTSVWGRIRILGYLRKSKSVCYNNSFHLSSEPNEYVENGKCTFKIRWKRMRAKSRPRTLIVIELELSFSGTGKKTSEMQVKLSFKALFNSLTRNPVEIRFSTRSNFCKSCFLFHWYPETVYWKTNSQEFFDFNFCFSQKFINIFISYWYFDIK